MRSLSTDKYVAMRSLTAVSTMRLMRAIQVFKALCDTTQLYCHSIFEQKYIAFSYMITRRKNYVAMRSLTETRSDEIANRTKR